MTAGAGAALGSSLAAPGLGDIRHGTTVAGPALCRRRGHGRRPPGHRGALHRPPGHGEGLPRRPLLGVAIAGAAGPAMEMVRLFQTQLEHYEKVEGVVLSLEGKANQLCQMVRANLPMAMQGLAVVPLFAGYDLARGTGSDLHLRRHRRPLRGDRAQRHRFGRPRRPHHHQARVPRWAEPDAAVELAIEALYEAADEDSATGGPDVVRGIYPIVATVTADGFQRSDDRSGRTVRHVDRAPSSGGTPAMTMPYYVAPEQVMKDRAEYAQKGIARGRSLVATIYDEGILIVAENPSRSLHKISEIYDRIAFAGVGKYNEFDQLRVSGIRHADTKGYAYSREDVDARSLANLYAQYLGQVFTHEMKPLEVEILVAELGTGRRPTSCTTSPTTERSSTRTASPCLVARPRPSPSGSRLRGVRTGR